MELTPFQTDEQLAERLRRVEDELRQREPSLAREVGEVARILDPDGDGPDGADEKAAA